MVSAKAFIGSVLMVSLASASATPETKSAGPGKLTIIHCLYSKGSIFFPRNSCETHFIYEVGSRKIEYSGDKHRLACSFRKLNEMTSNGMTVDQDMDKTVKVTYGGKSMRTGTPNQQIGSIEKLTELCKPYTSNDVAHLVDRFNVRNSPSRSKAEIYTGLPDFFAK